MEIGSRERRLTIRSSGLPRVGYGYYHAVRGSGRLTQALGVPGATRNVIRSSRTAGSHSAHVPCVLGFLLSVAPSVLALCRRYLQARQVSLGVFCRRFFPVGAVYHVCTPSPLAFSRLLPCRRNFRASVSLCRICLFCPHLTIRSSGLPMSVCAKISTSAAAAA